MRSAGWEDRLLAFVADEEKTPFSWQSGGCIGFIAAGVTAIRGTDTLPVVPSVDGPAEARLALLAIGAREVENCLMMYFDPVPVSLAQRGDIGVVTTESGQCAVINIGPHWVGKTESGVLRFRSNAVTRAFRV